MTLLLSFNAKTETTMPDTRISHKSYFFIALSLNLVSPEQLLENTGLTLKTLDEQDYIGVSAVTQAVRNLQKYCPLPHWRTLFGRHLGMTTHGVVGFATITAATLGQAITTFVKWEQLQSKTYSGVISQHNQHIEITITDLTGDSVYSEFFFEAFVKAMEILIVQLTGSPKNDKPTIYFQTNATDRQNLLHHDLLSSLHFNQSQNRLLIPKKLWQQASPLFNQELHQHHLRKCEQLHVLRNKATCVKSQIEYYLAQCFEQKIENQAYLLLPPSLEQAADSINLSTRTLTRKLQAQGTSFKNLLEAQRKALATELLCQAKYSIQDISSLLLYRESANFCRAFKKWFGVTPSEYRRS